VATAKKEKRPAGKLPAGWRLNDDLSLADLEAYFKYFNANQGSGSTWEIYGAALRAAVNAGWVSEPAGLTDEAIGRLSPAEATGAFHAVMNLYDRVTADDPNSSGPLPTT
jgi:hypothetical protein